MSTYNGRDALIHIVRKRPVLFVRSQALGSLCRLSIFALVSFSFLNGCGGASLNTNPDTNISPSRLVMFAPISGAPNPADHASQARIDVGRELYYDTHLSVNNSVSCNTCHQLAKYGVDGRAHSLGHDNRPGGRNAPTVYNAGYQFVQFWDGRAADLAAQAAGPMMNPVEMGMPGPDQVAAYVRSTPKYVTQLKQAFPGESDPVTLKTITTSIASFEDGLRTPSRWDRYLQGDTTALTYEEKQGLRVFLRSGCAACHAGRNLGGNSYQQLGAVVDWPDQHSDIGRGKITGQARDNMFLKVPTLRNVDQTGPYFHDGHVRTLEEAVRLMGRYQTGESLSDRDVASIVTFLHSLTGEIPRTYIKPPLAATNSTAATTAHADTAKGGE
jgi:cytochrome c peroxidase